MIVIIFGSIVFCAVRLKINKWSRGKLHFNAYAMHKAEINYIIS